MGCSLAEPTCGTISGNLWRRGEEAVVHHADATSGYDGWGFRQSWRPGSKRGFGFGAADDTQHPAVPPSCHGLPDYRSPNHSGTEMISSISILVLAEIVRGSSGRRWTIFRDHGLFAAVGMTDRFYGSGRRSGGREAAQSLPRSRVTISARAPRRTPPASPGSDRRDMAHSARCPTAAPMAVTRILSGGLRR